MRISQNKQTKCTGVNELPEEVSSSGGHPLMQNRFSSSTLTTNSSTYNSTSEDCTENENPSSYLRRATYDFGSGQHTDKYFSSMEGSCWKDTDAETGESDVEA